MKEACTIKMRSLGTEVQMKITNYPLPHKVCNTCININAFTIETLFLIMLLRKMHSVKFITGMQITYLEYYFSKTCKTANGITDEINNNSTVDNKHKKNFHYEKLFFLSLCHYQELLIATSILLK